MRRAILLAAFVLLLAGARAQNREISLTEYASLESVCGQARESDELLPMNELGMESGYLLYESRIELPEGGARLTLEHVRDYAAVYLDGRFLGTLTDACKSLDIRAPGGCHTLRLYAENIGRITYGPEILDNSKGLFGRARLNGAEITGWRIVPLGIQTADPAGLDYVPLCGTSCEPGFRRGRFDAPDPAFRYLDVSGWGMGEVWINGCYLGSYWTAERQQSIPVPDGLLRPEANVLVVFDLENSSPATKMHLSTHPVWRESDASSGR